MLKVKTFLKVFFVTYWKNLKTNVILIIKIICSFGFIRNTIHKKGLKFAKARPQYVVWSECPSVKSSGPWLGQSTRDFEKFAYNNNESGNFYS